VPEPIYLADMGRVSGGFRTGSVKVDGTTYGTSIWSVAMTSDETTGDNLGRYHRRFLATIRVMGDASTGAASTFELRADEATIYTAR
jgi:hypothetical protein